MPLVTALNGRLPSTMLTVADTGVLGPQRLRLDAAASWDRMISAGMPAGCLRSGYRTLAEQGTQDPTLAAPVGQSLHGEGIAADTDQPARSWITTHGLPYGWRIGFVPGEPWHAQYDRPDRHTTQVAPAPVPTPEPTPQEEDDEMAVVKAIIFDQNRPGMDDSEHPDFASTAIGWPGHPVITSVGKGLRDVFNSSRTVAENMGYTVEEMHADVNFYEMVKAVDDSFKA